MTDFLNCCCSLMLLGLLSHGIPNGADKQINCDNSTTKGEECLRSLVSVPRISDIVVRRAIAVGTPLL